MAVHLLREIENLKKEILMVGAMAELSVREATKAIETYDSTLALQVIDKDVQLDQMEVDVEEACLKVLALHQPVAADLRFIVAVLKINSDLERVGDLSVNIAERVLVLAARPKMDIGFDFSTMASRVQAMLKRSLDALVNHDVDLAQWVCVQDDEIDGMNRQMHQMVQRAIRDRPEHTEVLIHMLSAVRHLERIADHATNIAEDVIYMIKGEIIRHQAEYYESKP
ncbi:MAG: phosphate signaling complex protein PhoU [Phycisphaeraceae bacterium]|nr:phosphate signaling complex protein PhoU [Phycisphaeraceae bacterium]